MTDFLDLTPFSSLPFPSARSPRLLHPSRAIFTLLARFARFLARFFSSFRIAPHAPARRSGEITTVLLIHVGRAISTGPRSAPPWRSGEITIVLPIGRATIRFASASAPGSPTPSQDAASGSPLPRRAARSIYSGSGGRPPQALPCPGSQTAWQIHFCFAIIILSRLRTRVDLSA